MCKFSTISAASLQDFQKGLSIVRGLNFTNDAAERDVALNKSSFYFKSLRNIDEAYQIQTNQNWYKIMRTCNKQSDIKGEKCLITRIVELKILWLRISLLRNL